MPTNKAQKPILHIYTRVSTVAQADKGTSLQSQLELGKKRARDLGFGYRHWNEGPKSSHHEDITQRPVLFELYQEIRKGGIKHLWVYDQSRLSRNDHVASLFRYECNKNAVTLYTKDGKFDLSNPNDKLLKQMFDAFAEFENTARVERIRIGKFHRVKAGRWHGGPPPFGYRIDQNKLVIDITEAHWVKRIFRMYAGEHSTSSIKHILDGNAILTRRGNGTWAIGSIQKLLTNTHYLGTYKYRDSKTDQELVVACPRIIDDSLWNAVNKRRNAIRVRKGQLNRTKRFSLLRDFMFCAHCERPMGARIKPEKHEHLYYCPNKLREWVKNGGGNNYKRGVGCGMSRSINIPEANRLVWNTVLDVCARSSTLKQEVKQRLLGVHKEMGNTAKDRINKVERQVRQIQRQVVNVDEALAELETNRLLKKVSEDLYPQVLSKIRAEREKWELALKEAQLNLHYEINEKKWIDWVEQFSQDLELKRHLTEAQKRDYLKGVLKRIDVKYDKKINGHELVLTFERPLVQDSVEWRNPKNKREGYLLKEGRFDHTVVLQKHSSVRKTVPPFETTLP